MRAVGGNDDVRVVELDRSARTRDADVVPGFIRSERPDGTRAPNGSPRKFPALILHVPGFYGAAAAAERPTCGPVHELVQQVGTCIFY